MQIVEKPGVFFLGKPISTKKTKEPLYFDAKNFVTHALCIGMTGSGKTGLGIAILEEAALKNIPAIIIDPKGDLGNLLLTFPNLLPTDFLPWIDEGEAARQGKSPQDYAKQVATTWKDGLAEWGEGPDRIKSLKNAVEFSIYTPASQAGIPLSILSSFAAPSEEIISDSEAFRERILTTTSGLLGLLGITADPIKSKEHILISNILEKTWKDKRNLDLATLINLIQKPPFDKVGVFDIDTFFPAKERLSLSMSLNNLLASPGFQAWMEGEPLDIQRLLYTKEGKSRHSVISIAHLSDPERMFFLTLLLNELVAWMRRQTGTGSLRAIFYMDEIYGFFPPTAMPPSKPPMMTLLKQARAFGLGIVLATQNPVDLDYKGLSNCGTWFIGKLQTDRDKNKVLEGLKAESGDALNKMLSELKNRNFILKSVYLQEPLLFQTRWTMSYLRGPLTLPQIQSLMKDRKSLQPTPKTPIQQTQTQGQKPNLPNGITEYFIQGAGTSSKTYSPLVLGIGKLHFVDTKNKIDTWKECQIAAPLVLEDQQVHWDEGKNLVESKAQLTKEPPSKGIFGDLAAPLMQVKNYELFGKSFVNYLYQNLTFDVFSVPSLKLISQPGESEDDFKARIEKVIADTTDNTSKKIKAKYQAKIDALQDKIRKTSDKLAKIEDQAGKRKFDTVVSVGSTLLGAILGQKKISKTTINEAGTSIRRIGNMGKGSTEATQAQEAIQQYQQQLDDLESERHKETIEALNADVKIEKLSVRPRKGDLILESISLLWWPL